MSYTSISVGWTGIPECLACEAGKFKNTVGTLGCTDCPQNSQSLIGSTDCVCVAGYTGPDGGACTTCVAGKYKATSGSAGCTDCGAGKYLTTAGATTESSCVACAAGKYSTTVGASVTATCLDCAAGKYLTTTGAAAESACVACAAGTYSAATGATALGACVACPANSQPATASAAGSCLCNAGFRLDAGACAACPVATFKEAVGNSSESGAGCALLSGCCACGANETTLSTGSVHSDACVCQRGYENLGCAPCAVGYYKAEENDEACQACPAGSTTVSERSVVLADCVAAPGFFKPSGVGQHSVGFQQCPACSYTPALGLTSCTPCPAGSTSPAGATSESQCVCSLAGWRSSVSPETTFCACQPGFARDGNGLCVSCAANFYCVGGDAAPAACPSDAASPPGSDAVADCACNAGFETLMPLGACDDDPTYTKTTMDWMTFEEITLSCAGAFGPGGEYATTCAHYNGDRSESGCVRCCASCRDECATIWTDPAWAAFQPQPDPNAMFSCRACPADTYQLDNDCEPCRDLSSSPAGSSGSTQCACNAGYTDFQIQFDGQSGVCTTCAVGTYKDSAGSAECQQCAEYRTTATPASVSAAACVCQAGAGLYSGACAACPAGTFKAGTGDQACDACPVFTTSPPGSDAAADCQCNAGYSGPDGGSCTACESGKYKTSAGSAACTHCLANSGHALTAQTQATACLCFKGYTGANGGQCAECAAGQYKNTNGSAACTACPAGSSSPAGSDACVLCPAGKYRSASETVCTDCAAGKYSTVTGAAQASACINCITGKYSSTVGAFAASTCVVCPYNSTSVVAGGTLDNCHCAAGTAATLTVIVIGSGCGNLPNGAWTYLQEYSNQHVFKSGGAYVYKVNGQRYHFGWIPSMDYYVSFGIGQTSYWWRLLDQGSIEFIDLHKRGWSYACGGSGYFSMTQDVSQCTSCLPGKYATRGSHLCTSCPANTYSTQNRATSSATCLACPANSQSSTGSTSCLCNPGYSGPDSQNVCTQCPAGTYELNDACVQCPANAVSAQGASALAACLCSAGYFGPPGGPCRPCAHGSFSAANSIACAVCGPNANTSATASTSAAACLCVPGQTPLAAAPDACTPCAANTYKTTLSNTSCTACTQHSTSPPGSASPDACACSANFLKRAGNGTCARVCAAGFDAGGASLADCVGCRPGFYKTLEGDHACTPCPPNAFSLLANQTSISSCVCQHGYIWNAATLLCDACPPGTFNNQANESQCFACVTVC